MNKASAERPGILVALATVAVLGLGTARAGEGLTSGASSSFVQDRPALPQPVAQETKNALPVSFTPTPTASAPTPPQPAQDDKPWEIKFKAYAWLPNIDGRAGVGRAVSKVDVDLDDVLHALDEIESMVPINLEARCGNWGFIADLMYVKLEDQVNVRPRLTANLQASQTILELAGFYRAGRWTLDSKYGKSVTLDILGGARYNRLSGNIGLQAPRRAISLGGGVDWWDPMVGARLIYQATDQLNFFARGDVGGFGLENCSHFTWQFLGGAEYYFTKNVFVELGYRLLDTDYERGGARHFTYDIQMAGPYLAFGVKF